MADMLSILAADHQRIFELSNRLTGGAGEPCGKPSERVRVAKQLIAVVSGHEAIEEMLLWPLVRERIEGGDRLAAAALQQEAGGKRMLNAMDHMSAGNEEFMTLSFQVASHQRDHITYEESQIWPKVQLHVPREELDQIGTGMQLARRSAPTRPHPHMPGDPRLLRTVGVLVAAVDRARDAVTRRGMPRQSGR